MKQSGKLSGNTFTTKSNGETKSYNIEEKHSERILSNRDSDLEDVKYIHTTMVAIDESGNRAGTIESGATGNSFVLNTNTK